MQFIEKEYLDILEKFKDIFVNFENLDSQIKKKAFLRLDVEADLDKAVYLASLNQSKNVCGTFTIQVVSNLYNIHSIKNLRLIKKIHKFKQKIGLHYYSKFRDSKNFNFQDFKKQQILLDTALKELNIEPFKVFSYHRPTSIQLEASRAKRAPKGYIDCYSPRFFEYTDSPTKAKIKYMSDSDHEWKYGHPLNEDLKNFDTYQILMHPEEWPILDRNKVYSSILNSSIDKIKDTLETEYKYYSR